MNWDEQGHVAAPTPPTTGRPPTPQDNPRVAAALDAYLAELEAGRRPSREAFFAHEPELAQELAECLDALEFIHAAAGGSGSMSDDAPDASPEALRPAAVLGDYRLIRRVGRGGMGVVYEARQLSLDRRVALKVLPQASALDPAHLQRFRIEAQAAAQLHHPRIVPIYAVGFERGVHFYAMQFIEGQSLAGVIEDLRRLGREPLSAPSGAETTTQTITPSPDRPSIVPDSGAPPAERAQPGSTWPEPGARRGPGAFRAFARLGIQAAEALEHAHEMGILHRDIKPSNLLIDEPGDLWVADFGLALFQDEPGVTRTGDLVGTVRYMSPEQALGRLSFDPRSDVYSLGATLYELLTLRPAFGAADRQALLRQIEQEEPISPRRIDPQVPRDLETIVLKAMSKEPSQRYASARELAEDLTRFLEDRPILARAPTALGHAAKWARRHRPILYTAAAIVFAAWSLGSALLWRERQETLKVNKELQIALRDKDRAHQAEIQALLQGDKAFEQVTRLLDLADNLTMKGMEHVAIASSSRGPNKDTWAFYEWARSFYEHLTTEPHLGPRMHALAFRRLGFTRMVTNRDPRAEQDFRRSIAMYQNLLAGSPGDPELVAGLVDVQNSLGMWLMWSNRMGEAVPEFRRAISLEEEQVSQHPEAPEFVESLAGHATQFSGWLAERGKAREAESERRRLLDTFARLAAGASTSPERTRAMAASYRSLSVMLDRYGWRKEQGEVLRAGLKLAPTHPALLHDMAWFLTARPGGSPTETADALRMARKAVDLSAVEPEGWRALGAALFRSGEWQAAAKALERVIPVGTAAGDPSTWLLIAMTHWQLGDKVKARDSYQKAIDSVSKHPEPDFDVPPLRAEAEKMLGLTPTERSAKD